MMIGVIRVFTTEDSTILEQHGKVISSLYGVPTTSRCIPEQPLGIYDDATERIAVPKIVELGKEMEHEGCRVLLVSCAADPGVKELRKKVSIPVIGGGSAASLNAMALGEPVGVMGITAEAPSVMSTLLGDLMVGYTRPEAVTNTTDLLTPDGQHRAMEASRFLLNQGAKSILFACTGFSTIGMADVLRKELQVPVIDAVEAGGLFASALYRQFK